MLLLNCQKKEESDSKIRTDASQVIKICVPLFVQGADDQTRKAITHYVLTVNSFDTGRFAYFLRKIIKWNCNRSSLEFCDNITNWMNLQLAKFECTHFIASWENRSRKMCSFILECTASFSDECSQTKSAFYRKPCSASRECICTLEWL